MQDIVCKICYGHTYIHKSVTVMTMGNGCVTDN